MVKKSPAVSPSGLVLADIPERQQLRELQHDVEALRDTIAAVDLEIETLRADLMAFESRYHARLRPEHSRLERILGVVRHVERWVDLLQSSRRRAMSVNIDQRGARLQARRKRELKRQQPQKASSLRHEQPETPPPTPADVKERLKTAYRELARRFHPDLARTEEERVRHSQMMARINALYRAEDLERLQAMREQARGAELDESELSVDAQLQSLTSRNAWFEAVLKNLHEERVALEQTATCALYRNAEQAALAGRDLLDELCDQLVARIARAYDDVSDAIHALEKAVSRHNRKLTYTPDSYFDPYADKSLVRLGLEELGAQQESAATRRHARWLSELADSQVGMLRLLLFTYVSELTPLPLAGLETYDDLRLRYDALRDVDEPGPSLQEALVEADAHVEYGVRKATEKLMHTGLHFRVPEVRDAVPLALQTLAVRRQFKEVLSVLGERTVCPTCQEEIFAVPLYRLRGLDDLRASVCPACGATLRSYWMPKGKDVQAILSSAFLDCEIVSEYSFSLGRASIAMQLVPQQVETLKVGDLRQRLIADVFERHTIEIDASQVQLWQGDKEASNRTALVKVEDPHFVVRFGSAAGMSESDALEIVRHRIRTRFS